MKPSAVVGFVHRWRAYVLALVAVATVVLVPSTDDGEAPGVAAGAGPGSGNGPLGDSSAGTSAAGGVALDGGPARSSPSGGPATLGGARPEARPTTAAASTGAGPGAGIGSPEALAAPDCEAATGKIKISYIWRPACVIPWPQGADNGGATATGITATTIKVIRVLDSRDTGDDEQILENSKRSLVLFEHLFRTWGRKVDFSVYRMRGSDEAAQRAAAIDLANRRPFAVTGVVGRVLMTELAARGIVLITVSGVQVKDSLELAPYLWGPTIQPDELIEINVAEYAGRRLVNRPARWAGQAEYRVQTRKFGMVHPDAWNLELFKPRFSAHGGALTDSAGYAVLGGGGEASWGERAPVIVARMKQRGVTSVIAATDLLFTGVLVNAAASQNYFPEWITTGYTAQDLDLFAQTYNRTEWEHAFGPAGIPPTGPNTPWPQTWIYKWFYGNLDGMDGPMQSQAKLLYTGIHGAGPHLTPQTFRDGVFALPPSGGPSTGSVIAAQYSYGRWGFTPWDDYGGFEDFSEVYWDPNAVAPDLVTGQPSVGHYRHLNSGKRYLATQWPSDEPRMFDPRDTMMVPEDWPANDRPPDFPCTGCPSQGG